MTHLLKEAMFDKTRGRNMREAIKGKNKNGFYLTIPKHAVYANYDVSGKKFGYSVRRSKRINPFRLGFDDATNKIAPSRLGVKTEFLPQYSVVGITEGQKYFNSRMSMYYPDWQSRWFEQHGHNNYDIYIDVQRPKLIDINIRELSTFIEILKKTNKVKSGRIVSATWLVRKFEGNAELDRYIASGKRDTTCYAEEKIVASYNIHECYNSQMCKPKFYSGHMQDDFSGFESEPTAESFDGYVKYLEEFDDELPIGFYKQRGA
jgi:hypothetical protein